MQFGVWNGQQVTSADIMNKSALAAVWDGAAYTVYGFSGSSITELSSFNYTGASGTIPFPSLNFDFAVGGKPPAADGYPSNDSHFSGKVTSITVHQAACTYDVVPSGLIPGRYWQCDF